MIDNKALNNISYKYDWYLIVCPEDKYFKLCGYSDQLVDFLESCDSFTEVYHTPKNKGVLFDCTPDPEARVGIIGLTKKEADAIDETDFVTALKKYNQVFTEYVPKVKTIYNGNNNIKIFKTNTKEYKRLSSFANEFAMKFNRKANVGVCYFDMGQDWLWTTVIATTKGGDTYQLLNPRDHADILNGKGIEVLNRIKAL